ncbi:MAG: FAD binding domain-containing protein [Candidatus Promineifilaceae bacterium]|nr:FAD binding domain-containing protein [Candidatus Promineifilaceae bacterium]
MPQLEKYHRPESVESALELLGRSGVRTALVAGGTYLTPRLDEDVEEVVDLQAVGLDQIEHDDERMTVGAMVTIQAIVDDEEAPELLREMARREGPNTFRNQGTVGGAIARADSENEFLAALLVFEADVTVQTADGERQMALDDFLEDAKDARENGIVTAVSLAKEGKTADARVARTPADTPIVAAVGRRDGAGNVRLALCGVAERPIVVDPEEIEDVDPPADFRGSAEYRRQMAGVLGRRVVAALI